MPTLHKYETETRRIERDAGEYPQLLRFVGSPEDSGELAPVRKECDWIALILISIVALMVSATACAFIWRMFS